MCVCVCEREREREREKEREREIVIQEEIKHIAAEKNLYSHFVTGWVHDAAQLRCSGQPLNILEKYALLSDSDIFFLRE